ncbi:Protein of unknown function [Pyronema omphalodes CBS 100304]|uniref:Uncharacterized protein n=1 Tax=Pyronema omphalodes (strain CBS 100304) TaxID=1076935 RepID=U4L2C6_PYROM|nr:Protein of unknown function [Pyronema omphalodes CBS 100304]
MRVNPAANNVTTPQRDLSTPKTTPDVSRDELNCPHVPTLATSRHAPTNNKCHFKPDMHHSTSAYPRFARRAKLAKLAVDNARPTINVGAKHHKGNSDGQIFDTPTIPQANISAEMTQLIAVVASMMKSSQILAK